MNPSPLSIGQRPNLRVRIVDRTWLDHIRSSMEMLAKSIKEHDGASFSLKELASLAKDEPAWRTLTSSLDHVAETRGEAKRRKIS